MMAPRGLVGACLVAWGVSNHLPALGIGLGVAFESTRVLAPATPLPTQRITQVGRACLFAMVGVLGYLALTQNFPEALYAWLRWLPVILLPLPMMQLLAHGSLPRRALAEASRRGAGAWVAEDEVDATHAYVALTLVAAGMGNGAQGWLYAADALAAAWLLAPRFAKGRRVAAGALLAVAVALGWGIHEGVHALQGVVEEWGEAFQQQEPDPFRERTRIGDLGRIKLGDRIVMRVMSDTPIVGALLLREAAFDTYGGGQWRAQSQAGLPVPHRGAAWTLSEGDAPSRITFRRWLSNGEGLLPLPAGTRTVEGLEAQSLELLALGSARVRGAPRLLAAAARFDGGADEPGPTTAADLVVPAALAPALERVLVQEGLRRAAPSATLAAVRGFFDLKFAYSLQLSEGEGAARTIEDFLQRDRRGHCEYFATATVLLLRQAGIPARYVGGFSVQEWSPLEQAYVVRTRHAHAWASARVDGGWRFVDTTPARWAEVERAQARTFMGPLLDRLSWLWDQALQWALGFNATDAARLGAALAGAAAFLPAAVWIARRQRVRRLAQKKLARDEIGRAWDRIERRVARAGHRRPAHETLRSWSARLAREPSAAPWIGEWLELVKAYQSLRYDPDARAELRAEFLAAARSWRMKRRHAVPARA